MKTTEPASKSYKSELLLLFAAIIWGGAFVFQKEGGQVIGAFGFGGIRFFLGATVLLPVLFLFKKNKNDISTKKTIISGIIIGVALFF